MAVALKLPLPLPTVASPFPINIILFPPNPLLRRHGNSSSSTELRFSRWNNANAEPFLRRRRLQEEIETDLRLRRRYQSISNLTETDDSASPPPPTSAVDFKSNGTPSSPSRPSIPGRRSKYSKPPDYSRGHPAFSSSRSRVRFSRPPAEAGIVMGDKGLAYKVEGAPFEFQYSYTETPKVKPLALREAPFLPFGPTTMPRPWTGRAPLPPSKKKLPEFDSFKLPPPGKKGVKPVQAPGPYLSGSGPKYVATREEVIGDPLTKEEVKDLIKGCLKTRRQLNMGRDGLTHNMLDNIHAHWKRRRVCKIKCKGVCTVDMDNVSEQLEEKTGGKIIYCRGGAIFLFRGRNYNYRTRPRYPLMLWKPITPVYPRLVARAPEGLTLEEAADMRKRGRQLPPICKLGKNGVYTNLVKNVKEAFEACELVRIDCTGLNRSDCRKIGAKLKDLVPCVLISFEYEHILIWRGKYWNSSLPPQEDIHNKAMELGADDFTTTSSSISLEGEESSDLHAERSLNKEVTSAISNENITKLKDVGTNEDLDLSEVGVESVTDNSVLIHQEAPNENLDLSEVRVESVTDNSVLIHQEAPNEDLDLSEVRVETVTDNSVLIHEEARDSSSGESSDEDIHPVFPLHSISLDEASSSEIKDLSLPMPCMDSTSISSIGSMEESKVMAADSQKCSDDVRSEKACLDGIMLLLRQAVENGSALILDDEPLDANIVYERCIALARRAPPGPVFQHGFRRIAVQKKEKEESKDHKEQDLEVEAITIPEKRSNKKEISRSTKREDFGEVLSDVIPHGSLRVDELAKLLA